MELNELIRILTEDMPQVTRKVAEAAVPKMTDAIVAHWSSGEDPYGRQWARLKKNGQRSYLFDKGDMLASLNVRVSGNYLIWSISSPAQYHQYGTRKMVPRKLFPDDASNPPAEYTEAIEAAYIEVMERAFKGA